LIVTGLVLAKVLVELWLEKLNQQHVQSHSEQVPDAFKEVIDEPTYAKSIKYTLAKGRLSRIETIYSAVVLLVVLFCGVLPLSYNVLTHWLGQQAWVNAIFLLLVSLALSIPGLPLEWYHQFRLEERFGFNTSTQKVWWSDRLKGMVLALLIGFPLLTLVLKLVEWTGPWWWLWAWATLFVFQMVMLVLAPVLILPLFNKFTPLAEGSLRERLLAMAARTGFRAQSIQVMDGSKRSRHSNAFFTGFGGFRKIVLFDTLIQQLEEQELEAVLAHEIGHFKLKHIPKTLILSAAGSLAGLYIVSVLATQAWFYEAFGFQPGTIAPALLLFGLLSGLVTFWFSPLAHWWSRRNEYEADAFAAKVMTRPHPLISALRKLNEKNLSNLTPHPVFSGFYYSHPGLLEREQALLK
jgi:STE24 endopeptidase